MAQVVVRIADLASSKDKAGLLPVSIATIWRWTKAGRFPAPFKLGVNCTVWDKAQVEAWVAKQAAAGQ